MKNRRAVPDGVVITGPYGPAQAELYVAAIQEIFASVFAEPPYEEGPADVAQWREDLDAQVRRPGFAVVVAEAEDVSVGFAYGYTMTPEMRRWQRVIQPHAERLPVGVLGGGRVFTLMEFGVLSSWRGRGVGRALHDALLAERAEPVAILTVRPDAVAAQAAYRAWGWFKVGHLAREDGPGYDVLVRQLDEQ